MKNEKNYMALCTPGPRTTLPLGHRRCSVVQKSAVQGQSYRVSVLFKKISAVQGQSYRVSVLKTSAMQVSKNLTCSKVSNSSSE